jgi:hypothetical protein
VSASGACAADDRVPAADGVPLAPPACMNLAKNSARVVALAAILTGAPGCRVIGDIFKAGVWAGVLAIGFFALVVFGLVSLLRGRS